MNKHGVGPTDNNRKQAGRREEQLAFPRNAASEGLEEVIKRLKGLDAEDDLRATVSLERIVLALEALDEAESQYRLAAAYCGNDREAQVADIETIGEMSQKILSDLKLRRKAVPVDQLQVSAVLADKLASVWTAYFVAAEAHTDVLSIAKKISSISGLGKLKNIDDLPRLIREASHLSPLARFGLWGVSRAYFSLMNNDTNLAQFDAHVLTSSFNQAQVAAELATTPPQELAALNGNACEDKAQDAFRVACELLMKSVLRTTKEACGQGIFLRAQKALELVAPFISRLDPLDLRNWIQDYSMVCRQAHNQEEFSHAQEMWSRLEEIAENVGDALTVEALRITAGRVKSEMNLDALDNAEQGVRKFRCGFEKLGLEEKRQLGYEAMSVGKAAVSLKLRRAQGPTKPEHAELLLSDACKEVDILASLAEFNQKDGLFLAVESLAEVAMGYVEREDIESSHDRALELWKRASVLYHEADTLCSDDSLYVRIECSLLIAEVGAHFDDRDIHVSQNEVLKKLLATLVPKMEEAGLPDYERTAYQWSQIYMLLSLASVQCFLDEEGSGGGVEEIESALSLYEKYSIDDPDLFLLRMLYEVAVDVYEKNHLYSEAKQFEEKLERMDENL
jgi:hypothetical protein